MFWDLDNVPFYGDISTPRFKPVDQYELLLKVFGGDMAGGGAKVAAKLQVVFCDATLNRYSEHHRDMIRQQPDNVDVIQVLGRNLRKKREQTDDKLLHLMDAFISSANPGDAIVLISGDGDFEKTLRAAKVKNINCYLLHGPDHTVSRSLYECVHWAMPFNKFVATHKKPAKGASPGVAMAAPSMRTGPTVSATRLKRRTRNGRMVTKKLTRQEGKAADAEAFRVSDEVEDQMTRLDLLIMMDATGSMHPYIEAVKKGLSGQLLTEIRDRFPTAVKNMRFGFLAYRDIPRDGKKCPPHFEKLDFTSDLHEVVEWLGKVKATGGGDTAEDVVGAMMEASTFSWEQPLRAIFHIVEAPAHGRVMHDGVLDSRTKNYDVRHVDYYYERPPPGRDDPAIEIGDALAKLHGETRVERYFMCHLDRPLCDQMVDVCTSTLRAKGIFKNELGQKWMVHDEVAPGSVENPDQYRLSSLVGRMINATCATLSATIAMETLSRQRGSGVRERRNGQDDLFPTIPEGPDEGDEDEETEIPDDELVAAGLVQASSPSAHASDVKPKKLAFQLGPMSKREQKDFGNSMRKIKDGFRAQSRSRDPEKTARQVFVLDPPNYADNTPFEELMDDIKEGAFLAPMEPLESKRTLLIRPEPFTEDAKLKGTFKDAYLAQEQVAQHTYIERVNAEGRTQKYESTSKPLLVLKEFNTTGPGQNSEERYAKEVQASGVCNGLAHHFNEAVKLAEPRIEVGPDGTPAVRPKTLSYMPTSMVKYTVAGKNVFRLMEPFITYGKIQKWNNNAGFVADPHGNESVDWSETAQAFTHWTYHATQGALMVADVQGVKVGNSMIKLIDPQVHMPGENREQLCHQSSARGLAGMFDFFRSHTCGPLCRALGLPGDKDERATLRARKDEISDSE